MGGEWREATIQEVAEKVAMGPFGSSIKVETFVEEGVPVISGQHLHGSKVDDRVDFNFVTEEHAERLKNANVKRGDVIFTHAGNIGQVAFVPWDSRYERYVISQRQFFMRCDMSKVLPEFVVAYFKTPEGQHQLLANTSQTGVPSIAQPVTYLRTISIPVPPVPEQRAIAHILGSLDDKIELNRRMSETLEAMARALFKSWFVDFDPVRAKAEGRLPAGRQATPAWPGAGSWCVYALECEDGSIYIGHTQHLERRFEEQSKGKGSDWTKRHPPKRVAYWEEVATQAEAIKREKKLKSGSGREWLKADIVKRDAASGGLPKHLADLFPDSFEDSELGEIPKGWEVRPFGDLVADSISGDWGKEARDNVHTEAVAIIRGTDIPDVDSGGVGKVPIRYTTRRKLERRRLRNGDIVIEVSGGSPTQPTGRSLFVTQHILDRFPVDVVCASFCRRFRPLNRSAGIFASAHLDWIYRQGRTWEYQNQSTGIANFQTTRFLESELVVWPDDAVLSAFVAFLDPIQSRRSLNDSLTLAALRDTLLPKLISGELRVKDAERFVARIST